MGDGELLKLYFNSEPILEEAPDVLFVEKPCITPLPQLLELMPILRRMGPVVAIMHEGVVPRPRSFYALHWDLATVFDQRFYRLYGHLIRARAVKVVPYPFHPVVRGDRREARRALGLPEDREIVLSFGIRAKHLGPIMPYVAEVASKRDLMFLILAKHKDDLAHALKLKARYDFVEVRHEAPHYTGLYRYLHASDVILPHRPPRHDYIPVSSTVHLCLGALRPILCPSNSFFENYDGAVITYRGPRDMVEKLELILDGDAVIEEALGRAEELIRENTPDRIARELLELAFEAWNRPWS